MKQYLLFIGQDYYPAGGWDDFVGSFETLEQAQTDLNRRRGKQPGIWAQIVDVTAGVKVYEFP